MGLVLKADFCIASAKMAITNINTMKQIRKKYGNRRTFIIFANFSIFKWIIFTGKEFYLVLQNF